MPQPFKQEHFLLKTLLLRRVMNIINYDAREKHPLLEALNCTVSYLNKVSEGDILKHIQ